MGYKRPLIVNTTHSLAYGNSSILAEKKVWLDFADLLPYLFTRERHYAGDKNFVDAAFF